MSKVMKYKYPDPIPIQNRQWPDRVIKHAPEWCSVDLRDGNQALPVPMNPRKKLEYFNLLVKMGFKDIEVGFPSASKDDFEFVRHLIENNLIPKDVRISVLTQARPELIERTVESLKGTHRAILHLYVATSDLHGQMVFNRNREEMEQMSVQGTQWVKNSLAKANLTSCVDYEFSPEEFTDSDITFVIQLCRAVKEIWGPCKKSEFILNLPATVERRPPYQYADMIEYFCTHYPYMAETTLSVHAHNDQGCAVAASEMALLAGADRVEGTLFGHGERTGNVDLVTLALNLYSRGIDIGLDFGNVNEIVNVVERNSGLPVHPRHPYAGSLVFTAFSGSHQDAIRKGMENREKAEALFHQSWKVPYLHIDPADLGREYERLIRINSQSGKGGIAFILEREFGIYPPKGMHPEVGRVIQVLADQMGDEIDSQFLYQTFRKEFIEATAPYQFQRLSRVNSENLPPETVRVNVEFSYQNQEINVIGEGNGPISASVHALIRSQIMPEFVLEDFSEQSLGKNEDAKAIAFVGIRLKADGKLYYGAGEHANIDQAAIRALFSAVNRAAKPKK